MITKTNNILKVVEDGLCTGCGTCAPLCPSNAIKMLINRKKGIYIPKIDQSNCKKCEICYKVCPGFEVDFEGLNNIIFNKEPEDPLVGNYIQAFTGYSKDPEIRYKSSSGGLITQILIFALKEKIIDGALVTRMNKETPLEPEPFIARTEEEIIEASGSKYCPVPANIALKEILDSNNEKFAVVGLPCHIHGIRKAELINKSLKDKIVLHLGIFCNHTPNILATEYLLQKEKIKKENAEKISYRGGGWPGAMQITFKDKNKFLEGYWGDGFGQFFLPLRCTFCYDHCAELSDISFGDAWIPEIQQKDKIGTSILINRNHDTEFILNDAVSKEIIELKNLTNKELNASQSLNLHFKKVAITARINISKLLRKKIPNYNLKLRNPLIKDYVTSIILYTSLKFSSKKYFWPLMTHLIKTLQKIGRIL